MRPERGAVVEGGPRPLAPRRGSPHGPGSVSLRVSHGDTGTMRTARWPWGISGGCLLCSCGPRPRAGGPCGHRAGGRTPRPPPLGPSEACGRWPLAFRRERVGRVASPAPVHQLMAARSAVSFWDRIAPSGREVPAPTSDQGCHSHSREGCPGNCHHWLELNRPFSVPCPGVKLKDPQPLPRIRSPSRGSAW